MATKAELEKELFAARKQIEALMEVIQNLASNRTNYFYPRPWYYWNNGTWWYTSIPVGGAQTYTASAVTTSSSSLSSGQITFNLGDDEEGGSAVAV